MNDRAAQLSSHILRVIKDEPFEDVMPVLGNVQVFLLMHHADEPVLAVDRLAQFMRTQVRELVDRKAESDRVHRIPGHWGRLSALYALRENTILERFLDVWRWFSNAK